MAAAGGGGPSSLLSDRVVDPEPESILQLAMLAGGEYKADLSKSELTRTLFLSDDDRDASFQEERGRPQPY